MLLPSLTNEKESACDGQNTPYRRTNANTRFTSGRTEDGPWLSAVAVAELEEDVDDVGRSELEGMAADDPAD